jgi:hypothetical protein
MTVAFPNRKCVAFGAAAFVALVWLNQGPSMARFDDLTREAGDRPALRAWLPLAFLYRRSADEELYFALGRAVRGADFDQALVLRKRGDVPDAFRHFPPPDGRWHAPYSDVAFEYPPLVLPFVLLPALVASTFQTFAWAFGALMGAMLLASVRIGMVAAPASSDDRARWWIAAALFLAQGGLAIQRLDAIVALLLAVALWAEAHRKRGLFGFTIALVAAAKLVPALVLFPMLALDWDALRTRKPLVEIIGGVAAGLAVGLLPVALVSPSGLASLLGYHAARGLHVESTYGTVLSLVELAAGHPHGASLSFGSYNVDGGAATALALASTPLLMVCLVAFTLWLARRSTGDDEGRTAALAYAAMATLVCIWLFGKTFSPQYLTWAIPFAVVISDRRIALLLALAMALSQGYLRGFYDAVVAMRPAGVLVLVLRLVVIGALATCLLQNLAQRRARASS